MTQFNFRCRGQREINETLTANARLLGGQHNVNRAVQRLANAPTMLRAIYQSAQELDLDPLFIAAALFTELDSNYSSGPIDTYYGIGMDVFLEEYPVMQREGLLPPDFKKSFTRTSEVVENESGRRVRVATFRKIEKAIRAFAAILKHREELMWTDLAAADVNGDTLSSDERDYWTYVYFNSTYPKRHMIDERVTPLGAAGLAVPSQTFQARDSIGSGLGNAQRMLAIKWLLKWAGMVNPADPSTVHIDMHLQELFEILPRTG
jgi:hypothetical protein